MAGNLNKAKFLGSHVWLIIQARYEKGDGVRKLAKEYNINPATICNRAKKFGWLAHGQLKEDAMTQARDAIKTEFTSTYKELAHQAMGNHHKIHRMIQQMCLDFVKEVAANSKRPAAEKKDINREIYQLNVLTQTMKTAIDGERLALGMDSFKWQDEEKDAFSKFAGTIAQMRGKKELEDSDGETVEVPALPETIDGSIPEEEEPLTEEELAEIDAEEIGEID
jgi:hypothetical protein